jgi:hypothetical protein
MPLQLKPNQSNLRQPNYPIALATFFFHENCSRYRLLLTNITANAFNWINNAVELMIGLTEYDIGANVFYVINSTAKIKGVISEFNIASIVICVLFCVLSEFVGMWVYNRYCNSEPTELEQSILKLTFEILEGTGEKWVADELEEKVIFQLAPYSIEKRKGLRRDVMHWVMAQVRKNAQVTISSQELIKWGSNISNEAEDINYAIVEGEKTPSNIIEGEKSPSNITKQPQLTLPYKQGGIF